MATAVVRVLRAQVPIWFVVPLFAIAMAAGAAGGYAGALRTNTPCPLGTETCTSFGSFWRAWQLLSQNYVDPAAIESPKMIDGAITGMVDSLGDEGHTRYLPPEIARAERESLHGSFEGIGAYLDVRDGQPVVIEPIEGSPAERAGLRAGDRIVQVDGKDVRGTTLDALRAVVRGPRGTTVVLAVERDGQAGPLTITIVRDEINVPAASWRMLPGQVAYIQLTQFSERAGPDLHRAIVDSRAQGATSVVLDLRNNPGGFVDQLLSTTSEFLPKGTTVLIEQDRNGKRVPYTAREGGAALDLPLVVLVNQNSASSAEIMAAALGEAGRARVIGEPTFGTATVLRTFQLENGGELRIGMTQWLTPRGEMVRGKGITPDEIVSLPEGQVPLSPSAAGELDAAGLQASGDAQLLRALAVLGEAAGR
jgi:carboxyl-terminal processing protease